MANNNSGISTDQIKLYAQFTLDLQPVMTALLNNDIETYTEKFKDLIAKHFTDDSENKIQFLVWLLAQLHVAESELAKTVQADLKDIYFDRETVAAMVLEDPSYYHVAFQKE